MATHVPCLSVYEQARREHEQIRERLKFLRHELEQRRAPLDEIVQLLAELRDCLDTHFRDEERDGFFDKIVARAPQLSRKADSLSREHAELLQELDTLIRSTGRVVSLPRSWRTLTAGFHVFMKKLMHHESEENSMMQQAHVDDLGTKD